MQSTCPLLGVKRTWAIAVQMSDPKRTSRPTLRYFTHLIAELTKIASRREISALSVRATSKSETEPKLSSDCPGNTRKDHREFSKLMRKMEGPIDGGVMEGAGIFVMSAWSNWVGKFCFIAALAVPIALSGASLPVSAQDQQDQQQPQQQPLNQQELAQLVAPIALYPDALLAQVLTASTYPLEVVMAARWSEKNPDLKGAALEDAMQKEPWDPSVKGLTSVPQVLAMMSDKLDWTQQLGEAFLAQPDDIQNAI